MAKQTLRFAVSVLLIVFLVKIETIFPGIDKGIWYFDKYKHAFAGILLMIGFFDAWKRTAGKAFIMLLVFNAAWESLEIYLSMNGYVFRWQPFDKKWLADTATDVIVTTGSGMHYFYLSEYLIKRNKKQNPLRK